MDLQDSLDRVRPEVLHAPPDLMVQTMRDVIRDFCNFTRAWVYEVELEQVLALVSDYDIELPGTYAWPIAIEFMSLDGTPVYFKTKAWLDANISNWRRRSCDDFRYFTQLSAKQFTFPCVPTRNGTVGGLEYRVQLTLTQDASEIDDDVFEEWVDTWSCGTKARLLAMAGKDWSNPTRAAQLEAYYHRERGLARIRADQSRGNASQQWSNPRGFA